MRVDGSIKATVKRAELIKGYKGDKGEDGKSAYEVAVEKGYSGTEEEWIESLKGDKGDKGEDGNSTGVATTAFYDGTYIYSSAPWIEDTVYNSHHPNPYDSRSTSSDSWLLSGSNDFNESSTNLSFEDGSITITDIENNLLTYHNSAYTLDCGSETETGDRLQIADRLMLHSADGKWARFYVAEMISIEFDQTNEDNKLQTGITQTVRLEFTSGYGLTDLTAYGDDGSIVEWTRSSTYKCCLAHGGRNTCLADYTHVEGVGNTVSGEGAHAEGNGTTASGAYSHSEGINTTASGEGAHAEGNGTKAIYSNQHVEGKYNQTGSFLHIVGNGTDDENRSNAYTLDNSGNGRYAGEVYVNNDKVLITKEAVESIRSDLESKISAIPKFSISVVNSLPTSDISTSTVYLVKTSSTESGNLYTEYIYTNDAWEQLGTQSLDLSGYLKTADAAATYAKQTDVASDISSAKATLQESIETKQNKLTAGNNVTITGDVISATDTVYDDTNIKSSINTLNTNVTSIQNTVSNDIYTKTQVDNKTTALNDSITTTKTELATAITNKQDILSGSQNIEISDNALNITEYLSNYLTTMDNTKYLYIHRPSADSISTYYSTLIYTLQDLRSNNTDTVKTIIQKWRAYLLKGKTVTYYSSLSDAVSSSNALSSSTGAVVSVASTGFADVYKLLADITVSSDIAFVKQPIILMINGYTLTLSSAVISKSNASTNFSNLCIDGTDVGSTIKMVGTAQIKASGNTGLQLIGGTYTISDATVSSAFNVNYIQDSSNSSTYYYPIAPIIMWNTNITGTVTYTNYYNLVDLGYILSDSSQSLFANNTITLTGAKVGACIARWGGKLTSEPDVFEFINETYKCIPTSGTTYNDYASPLLMFAEGNVIVRNCNLEGINDAVHSNGDLFIENSKLTGHVHGGAYIMGNYRYMYNKGYIGTDIMATRAYIMNTEIIGGNTNPHSCYFGYGANVYCDGVSFKTYDGSDYTPAIKSGDDIGDPAIVYFSNCSMKSLRLDANCHAVLGLGISNTIKNATYNGTKTVDNSVHRYKLVEEL